MHDELNTIRADLSKRMLHLLLLVALLASLIGLYRAWHLGTFPFAVPIALGIGMGVWINPGHRVRVVLIVAAILLAGLLGHFSFGLLGQGRVVLLTGVACAMLLAGRRAALFTMLLGIAVMLLYRQALESGLFADLPLHAASRVDASLWWSNLGLFVLNCLVLSAIMDMVLVRLQRSRASEEEARRRLEQSNEALEQRVRERTLEIRESEQRTTELFEALPAAMFVSDWRALLPELEAIVEQGDPEEYLRAHPETFRRLAGLEVVETYNPALFELLGVGSMDELRDLMYSQEDATHEFFLAGELLRDYRTQFRSRERRADGSSSIVDWSVVVPGGARGDWSRVIGVGVDVTQSAAQETLLARIFDHSSDGLILIGPDLRVLAANDRYYDLLEMPRDRLPPGTPIEAFVRFDAERGVLGEGDPETRVRDALDRIELREEHPFAMSLPSGTHVEGVATPTPDGGQVIVIRDVTQAERSRAELQRTVDAIDEGLLSFDRERVRLVNRSFGRHTGIDERRFIGAPVEELVAEACRAMGLDFDEMGVLFRELATAGGADVNEPRLLSLTDGRTIRLGVVSDDQGGYVLVVDDVTDTERAKRLLEDALLDHTRRMALLVETANVAIIALDADRRMIDINRHARRLFRIPPEESGDAMRLAGAADEASRRRLAEAIDAVFAGRDQRDIEMRISREGDDPSIVVLNITVLRNGGVQGALLVGTDLTEVRLAEQRLMHAAKLATLGEMSTAIAHELNQPLQVIQLAAANVRRRSDRVEDAELRQEIVGKLERIEQQVARAGRVINHMRRFGRAEVYGATEFDVSAVVAEVAGLFSEQLRLSSVELRLGLAEGAMGYAIPDLLQQVVSNLLSNGRDQLDSADCVERWIEITTAVDGASVVITVEDSGGGVEPGQEDRIFEAFYTTKPAGVGTGLGLSLSREMVEKMDGRITMCNGVAGARFTITLPCAEATHAADSEAPPG